MPLDVYPDPSGRYREIIKNMPREILLAACQVTGTHIHIGMPDHETALKVYNAVVKHMTVLREKGNGSFGERIRIYKMVAPNWESLPYRDWNDFYDSAVKFGFENDPRRCWNLIRISVHGTIEFRMFGSTPSFERIISWARSAKFAKKRCYKLITREAGFLPPELTTTYKMICCFLLTVPNMDIDQMKERCLIQNWREKPFLKLPAISRFFSKKLRLRRHCETSGWSSRPARTLTKDQKTWRLEAHPTNTSLKPKSWTNLEKIKAKLMKS